MSEIRVTNIIGENGSNPVGLSTGFTVGPTSGTTGIGVTITHQGHAQFAGVCTATSFSGSGDTNTKITFPAADTITAETGGTERLRINADGDLLVGRTSTIDTSERLGIKGPDSDHCTFGITSDGTNKLGIIAFNDDDATFRGRIQYDHNTDSMQFRTASTEKLRINSDGKVDVGTQAGPSHAGVNIAATDYPTLRLWDDQKSDNFVLRYHNSTQRVQFINNHQGVYLGRGATSFGSLSDERAKTIISNITGGLEKIKSLRTIIGKYNDDPESKSRPFLIAQDVQSVLPEAVDARDTDNLGLRYTDMIPLLTNALQESITKIETLEAKVAALEGS